MTLRELVKTKSTKECLKELARLNIGLSNTVFGSWASIWSIGYHEPTSTDIETLRKLIKKDSILLGKGVDHHLSPRQNWVKIFEPGD